MNKKALIISLNFNPGHLSHLFASYNQLKEIGYRPQLLIHKKFNQFEELKSYNVIHDIPNIKMYSTLFFWFPSIQNLKIILISILKFNNTKIFYVYHEPFESIKIYRKAGFNFVEIFRLFLILIVSYLTCIFSTCVILPSKKAEKLYKNSLSYKLNNKILQIPLLFINENNTICKNPENKKKYFSYIGTIANDHAFKEFVNFIRQANEKKHNINFLIATKNRLERKFIDVNLNYPNLKIIHGKPLSNLEINRCYSSSLLVWNAYHRTTQSGVMAKAFMFGAPIICLKKNRNEFTLENINTLFISKYCFKEIYSSYRFAYENINFFEKKCSESFQRIFHYSNYNNQIYSILKN